MFVKQIITFIVIIEKNNFDFILLAIVKLNVRCFLFECCNHLRYVHLQVVFQQILNVVDLAEYLLYLVFFVSRFQWYLMALHQGLWFYPLKSVVSV